MSWRYGSVGKTTEADETEEEEEAQSGASTLAADTSFPFKRTTTPGMLYREMRDVRRLMTSRHKNSPRNAVCPRKPRYMRPSTAMALTSRRIINQGLPSGVCVTDIDTYHRNYCDSIDTTSEKGVIEFGNVNNRFVQFWKKVPAYLDRHHKNTSISHKRHQSSRNSIHHYVNVKPRPSCRTKLETSHHRTLIRLYDRTVKEKPAEVDCTPTDCDTTFFHCHDCDCETIRHRYTTQCPSCHRTVATVSSGDRNFKEFEQCSTQSIATYKRINHFNEWLARTQGIEQRTVPDAVLTAVELKLALVRAPITENTSPKVVYNMVREALTLSRYQDYFEHVPQIIKKLTPLCPPVLSAQELVQIRAIFIALQGPFERRKPKGRRNFLSYSYVIYKLCELLELDLFLPYCPLFKSIGNQRNADLVWKAMCQDMGYEFIPTV